MKFLDVSKFLHLLVKTDELGGMINTGNTNKEYNFKFAINKLKVKTL